MKSFFKKHWSNLLFSLVIALLLIPQTSLPIKVFFTRIMLSSPSVVDTSQEEYLNEYAWSLKNSKGDTVNFKKSKNNVVFLNFWATWCPPCVAELPEIQSLYNKYGNQVDFYLVTQENPDKVKHFLQEKGYKLPIYFMSQAPPAPLEVQSIPRTLILSKKGAIVIDETGAADWDSEKVHQLLEKLVVESVN